MLVNAMSPLHRAHDAFLATKPFSVGPTKVRYSTACMYPADATLDARRTLPGKLRRPVHAIAKDRRARLPRQRSERERRGRTRIRAAGGWSSSRWARAIAEQAFQEAARSVHRLSMSRDGRYVFRRCCTEKRVSRPCRRRARFDGERCSTSARAAEKREQVTDAAGRDYRADVRRRGSAADRRPLSRIRLRHRVALAGLLTCEVHTRASIGGVLVKYAGRDRRWHRCAELTFETEPALPFAMPRRDGPKHALAAAVKGLALAARRDHSHDIVRSRGKHIRDPIARPPDVTPASTAAAREARCRQRRAVKGRSELDGRHRPPRDRLTDAATPRPGSLSKGWTRGRRETFASD